MHLANERKSISKLVGEAGPQSYHKPHAQHSTGNQGGMQNPALFPEEQMV